MSITKKDLIRILQTSFPAAEIEVTALAKDNDHYSVRVKSGIFNGKSLVQQHRMVYDTLTESGVDIHAIAICTEESILVSEEEGSI